MVRGSFSPLPVAPEGSRLSVEQLLTGEGGRSGEFLLLGGSTSGLSVFVTTLDLLDGMCLGAMAGSVKFYTLEALACSFTTHSKKVGVCPEAIYISTGHQSAFTHHYAPVALLLPSRLSAFWRRGILRKSGFACCWGTPRF
jgi:hypothetical protein